MRITYVLSFKPRIEDFPVVGITGRIFKTPSVWLKFSISYSLYIEALIIVVFEANRLQKGSRPQVSNRRVEIERLMTTFVTQRDLVLFYRRSA